MSLSMEALELEPRSEHFIPAFKPAQRSESPSGGGSPSPQNDADDEEDSDRDARQLDSKESKPRKPHLQVIILPIIVAAIVPYLSKTSYTRCRHLSQSLNAAWCVQGRFSGRLETKQDEKRLAEECKILGPLLGGSGKRGEKSRLTLAKIVRGIASGDVRKHCEAREAKIEVRVFPSCRPRMP